MSRDVGKPPEVDFAAAMSNRYTPEPATVAPAPRPTSGKSASDSQPAMTRRSWLLPVELADAFAAAAARIHHQSQGAVSKSAAQAALLRVALDHESEVAAALLEETTSESHG